MLKVQRHAYIMEKLQTEQKVVTANLALDLSLSEDTIRRDLNEMDRKKLLKKVYGGALIATGKSNNTFSVQITAEDKKEKIVSKALS